MLRKNACWWLLLACCLTVAGCAKRPGAGVSSADGVDAALAEINSFTDELVKRVEGASDTSAGVTEAQSYLDGRRVEIRLKIVSVRRAQGEASAEARRKLLESEVENTDRVARLRARYFERSMSDAAFSEKLDALVKDFQSLFGN